MSAARVTDSKLGCDKALAAHQLVFPTDLKRAVDFLSLAKEMRIFDVACGYGFFSHVLADQLRLKGKIDSVHLCRQVPGKYAQAISAGETRMGGAGRPRLSIAVQKSRHDRLEGPSNMDQHIQTRFIQANGLSFEVDQCGNGDRLALCLHGFPECSYSWRHQLPMLAQLGYTAWAPNLRGYGRTSRPLRD